MSSYNINWNKSSGPPEVWKFWIWSIPRNICHPWPRWCCNQLCRISIFTSNLKQKNHIYCVLLVAQLIEAWAVNHAVGRSSPSWVKLTKILQQASNPKIAESFGSVSKLGGLMYHNIIVGTLKIQLCPLHIGQVLRLPGAVSPYVLLNAFFRTTLTVPEVVLRIGSPLTY